MIWILLLVVATIGVVVYKENFVTVTDADREYNIASTVDRQVYNPLLDTTESWWGKE